MRTKISSEIIIEDFSDEIWEWTTKNLIIKNPMYEQLMKLGKEDTIRYKRIPKTLNNFVVKGNKLYLPQGCLYAVWKMIKKYDFTLDYNDNGTIGITKDKIKFPLYDYQEKAVSFMKEAKGGVLVAPCGSGKTFMGIELVKRIGKKFIWLTHTKDLLNQAYNDFKLLYPNVDLGQITQGVYSVGRDGAICTIQTLATLDSDLYKNDFDIVICDECSHVNGSPTLSKMFYKCLKNIKARYKYGLTATPSRSDTMIETMYAMLGLSRKGKFEPTYIIERENVKTIECNHVLVPMFENERQPFSVVNGDGTINYMKLMDYVSNLPKRDDIILNNIEKCFKEGRKQVVLCSRVEHCERINKNLLNRDIKSELVIGKVSSKKRKEVLENPQNWDVIVATYSLLKEGVSINELDTLHLTTPQSDDALIVQCVGRIERYIDNKKQPIAYDYVDMNINYCINRFNKRKKAIKRRKQK